MINICVSVILENNESTGALKTGEKKNWKPEDLIFKEQKDI